MNETDRTGLRPRQASHEPTRTCLGCRGTDSWSVLLRVTAREGDSGVIRIVPDVRRRLGGRGAWLHTDSECVEQAVRRRAFARALRVGAPVDLTPLTACLDRLRT